MNLFANEWLNYQCALNLYKLTAEYGPCPLPSHAGRVQPKKPVMPEIFSCAIWTGRRKTGIERGRPHPLNMSESRSDFSS